MTTYFCSRLNPAAFGKSSLPGAKFAVLLLLLPKEEKEVGFGAMPRIGRRAGENAPARKRGQGRFYQNSNGTYPF